MLKTLHQILRTGIVTEPPPLPADESACARGARGGHSQGARSGAVHPRGGCGVLQRLRARDPCAREPDLQRRIAGNPLRREPAARRHAAGHRPGVAPHGGRTASHLRCDTGPKLVVAVGDCGACGGVFGSGYASLGAVSNVIPVDVVVPGCPPSPTRILAGILAALSSTRAGSVTPS